MLTLSQQNTEFSLQLSARFARQIQVLRRHKELLAVRSASEHAHLAMADALLKSNIKQLAASLGLTYKATYLALTELVEAGLILVKQGEYILLNKDA